MLQVRVGPRYTRIHWDIEPRRFDFSPLFDKYTLILEEKGDKRPAGIVASGGETSGSMKVFSEDVERVIELFREGIPGEEPRVVRCGGSAKRGKKQGLTVGTFISRQGLKFHNRYHSLFGLDCYQGLRNIMPHSDHGFHLGPYLISRPYPLGNKDMKEILEWADKFELCVTFRGSTSWHPDTMTILAYSRSFADEFHAAARSHGDGFESAVNQGVHRRIYGEMYRLRRGRHPREHESGVYILNTTVGYRHTGDWRRSLERDEVVEYLQGGSGYSVGEPE